LLGIAPKTLLPAFVYKNMTSKSFLYLTPLFTKGSGARCP